MATADTPRFGWSVPREGRYWLAATAVLIFAGWLKSINLVLVLAYFLAALWLLNAVVVRRALRRVSAQRLWVGPVWAGEPAFCETVVSHPGRGTAPLFQVGEVGPGVGVGVGGLVEGLGGGKEVSLRGQALFPLRGRVRLPALAAWCSAPLGLVERRVELAPAEDVVVLPRRGTLHRDRLDRWLTRVARGDGRPHLLTRPSVLRDTDLYGLRPFRPGDSPRHIHWRTSARRGELMVREFADAHPRQLLLIVAPDGQRGPAAGARLEALVSLAATLAWEWCRQTEDQLWVVVGGPAPRSWGPISIREQTLPAQTALAELGPVPGNADELIALAGRAPESTAPLVVGDPAVADRLSDRLRRPIACLAPGEKCDFYQPPRERPKPRGWGPTDPLR